MSRLTRRQMLGVTGGVVAATAVGFSVPALSSTEETGTLLPSLLKPPEPFRVPLPVPAVLAPGRHPDHPGADYYEITDQVAHQEIIPGTRTEVWGPGGTFPGPTLVSYSGRPTVVRRINTLPVPTVNHLHGGHVPAASDGFPTDLVYPPGYHDMGDMPGMPGDPLAVTTTGHRDYEYPMDQRAATLWYHDHRMGFTGPAVWNGLAGFHIVRDREEAALPLPGGDRDVPLMIADRSFTQDGSLRYPAADGMMPGVTETYMNGVLGDVILVNGAPWPVMDVAAVRYRLRILNASNARRYRLSLGLPIVQIGSDGGLLDRPVTHTTLDVAPAERFDVVVDFSGLRAGQEVTLTNQLGTEGTANVMRFRVTGPAPDTSRIPERLADVPRIDRAEATVVRDFTFQKKTKVWGINGEEFDPTRAIARPRLGDWEIWRFVTDLHHPVHMHLAQFQVLSRNGKAPGPTDAGWKDTVDLRPAELAEVIVRFTGYRGRYVLHCHNLEHEDMAMMAMVEVV
ncbi:multicopper oxidase family protein [Actinocrispum wychmicini]|uniref:Multicopper oxidase CueO n=1 Tax=Actinocrispum wychmicini TaxID=1213861 RepID=A0A4R2JKB6_9PSEU|nr:multicopper oxidase family protein [Actinocrispum wychmicini]TCO60453.1 spore coat protein A [Actinocrispum wychmicini]